MLIYTHSKYRPCCMPLEVKLSNVLFLRPTQRITQI